MKSADEIDEYFQTLLNYELPEHKAFMNELKQKFTKSSNNNNNNKSNNKKQMVNIKKFRI